MNFLFSSFLSLKNRILLNLQVLQLRGLLKCTTETEHIPIYHRFNFILVKTGSDKIIIFPPGFHYVKKPIIWFLFQSHSLFTDLEDKLFETTEKPTEDTEFTTEMDFMYPMIMDPVTTTKRPEPKMTTSIIDKVVEFLTTTPTPATVDDSEFSDDDTKGQLISKCPFGIFNFSQKTNENKSTWGIIRSSKVKMFRSFYGRIEDTKKSFWNYLTFRTDELDVQSNKLSFGFIDEFSLLKLEIIINMVFLDFAWNGNAICGNSFYKTGNLCFETSLHRIFCSRGMGSLLLCRHTYFELWTGVSARIIICFRKLKWGLGCSKNIRCWRGEGWTKKINRPTSKPFPYFNSSIFSPICFTNFFPRIFLSLSNWKRKQTSYLLKTGVFSQFASWKRNHNKYSLKKFVDSEFEIGETIWWMG